LIERLVHDGGGDTNPHGLVCRTIRKTDAPVPSSMRRRRRAGTDARWECVFIELPQARTHRIAVRAHTIAQDQGFPSWSPAA
jgi:hypothetical protein